MKSIHWTSYYFILMNFHSIYSSDAYVSFMDSNEVDENSDCLLSPVILSK